MQIPRQRSTLEFRERDQKLKNSANHKEYVGGDTKPCRLGISLRKPKKVRKDRSPRIKRKQGEIVWVDILLRNPNMTPAVFLLLPSDKRASLSSECLSSKHYSRTPTHERAARGTSKCGQVKDYREVKHLYRIWSLACHSL